MKAPAMLGTVFVFTLLAVHTAHAQVVMQPTPPPAAGADGERWFIDREPVPFAGNTYFPAGPRVHFDANEMIRSGYFQGIPLYTRTTLEPYSIVFVPLQGGLMQPYERLRTGDVAGTVGSRAPSFPLTRSIEPVDVAPQAPAPPVLLSPAEYQVPISLPSPAALAVEPEAVGTSGRASAAVPVPAPRPARVRRSPATVFLEFGGNRYFTSGSPVAFDAVRFVRIGDYHGFPVYRATDGPSSTIYVPVAGNLSESVSPVLQPSHPPGILRPVTGASRSIVQGRCSRYSTRAWRQELC